MSARPPSKHSNSEGVNTPIAVRQAALSPDQFNPAYGRPCGTAGARMRRARSVQWIPPSMWVSLARPGGCAVAGAPRVNGCGGGAVWASARTGRLPQLILCCSSDHGSQEVAKRLPAGLDREGGRLS
ncbi:hypothetical protein GCM10010347_64900 [Streptomyces cirratus]|uniref:Uncharacterized protein n=1 Tax=Streptomyces cirratus TaxID=68187 RepID=A0ABQ3F5C7_9ACTN|nr:hypothetical protein GCM10010347_64900 [Streptomyces cirratus]